MIACTQTFFNELDLLEIKLNSLKGVVDVFIIAEATRTYTGINKPLHFDENKERFKDFPIHHIIIDDLPGDSSPWDREGHQHNKMADAVASLKPDVIIWNDLDELITPSAIAEFMESKEPVMGLEMDWLRYYFNREHNRKWAQRVISRDGRHHVSSTPDMKFIKNAGWHFNYCTSREMLLDKINATSHCVEGPTRQFWNDVRQGRHPQIELTTDYDEKRLPLYIQQNRDRFASQFMAEGAPLV